MSEIHTIAKHAITVLAGQLAVMAYGITDTIVAGQFSAQALAALSVASAIFISVYISLMGVLQALLPLWSELYGQQHFAQIGSSFRQSLYLAIAATLLGMYLLISPDKLLEWASVPSELRSDVTSYLDVVAFALPAALFFRIFSTLNQSIGAPQLVTWLQVTSLLPKIGLSIWMTFGGLGLTSMGAEGCAWATLIVQYVMALMGALMLYKRTLYAPLRIFQRIEPPDWKRLVDFLRLGLPAGLAIGVEVTSFTWMALLIAQQGSLASASHQIAANLAAVCYMVPLSLSIAASARISYFLGARHYPKAMLLTKLGLWMTLGCGLTLAAMVYLAREWITSIYTQDPLVMAMAATLLTWVALYHVADSVQCYCVFILRSFRVTLAPLVTYSALLWGAGLGGGYWIAYSPNNLLSFAQTPNAFWATTSTALAATAMIFIAILYFQLQKLKGLQGTTADNRPT